MNKVAAAAAGESNTFFEFYVLIRLATLYVWYLC